VPLDRQAESDLIWIREPFLSWGGDAGKVVVHGHTVEEHPTVRGHRIGIDTGACWTNNLTCVVLEGESWRFLSTLPANASSARPHPDLRSRGAGGRPGPVRPAELSPAKRRRTR
jgi:hypothetical protein